MEGLGPRALMRHEREREPVHMESVTVQAARAAPSLVRPTVYRVVRSVSGAEGWDLGMCVYRVRWVNYLFESCMCAV